MPPRNEEPDEERPLLHPDNGSEVGSHYSVESRSIDFEEDDPENPRAWVWQEEAHERRHHCFHGDHVAAGFVDVYSWNQPGR